MTAWTQTFWRYCRPRSQMTGSQWAQKRRYIPPGTSPEPGDWRNERVPYLVEVMDAATDRTTETVVMMFSSQVAKSEAQLNIMGYYADQDPSPQMVVYPTEKLAEKVSKTRIDPMFQYSKGLKDINTAAVEKTSETEKEAGKSRGRPVKKKVSNTILEKFYPGGYIAMVGSESPSNLASMPIRILHVDEVDRCGDNEEGDSLKLAIQRTTNFSSNRKIILASTPTVTGRSKIHEWWLKSDQRYYHVTCPHCGLSQHLTWAHVHYDKDGAEQALPHTARVECESCDGILRGAGKPPAELLAKGFWVKTRPESRIAGFHINSLYSPWVDLYKLVEEWVEANKSRDKKGLMEFWNLKLGLPYEDRGSDLDYEQLHRTRPQDYGGALPDDVLMLTVGCDTQDNYLAAECVGWGVGKERWGVEYKIFYGDPDQPDVWERFTEWRRRIWLRRDGVQLRVVATMVDSGGNKTDAVYKYCAAHENEFVYAIKGRGGDVPMIGKPARNNRWNAPRIDLGVDALKSATLHAATIDTTGSNFCHWPDDPSAGYDVAYFKGLLSERLDYHFDKAKGKTTLSWKKVHERNEPLDVRNYATAAMELRNPNFEALAANLAASAGRGSAPPPQPQQPVRRRGTLSRGVG